MEASPIAMCGWNAFVANVIASVELPILSLAAVLVCSENCPKHAVARANKKSEKSDQDFMISPDSRINPRSNDFNSPAKSGYVRHS